MVRKLKRRVASSFTWITLITCLMVVVLFTGCEKKDPNETYQKAIHDYIVNEEMPDRYHTDEDDYPAVVVEVQGVKAGENGNTDVFANIIYSVYNFEDGIFYPDFYGGDVSKFELNKDNKVVNIVDSKLGKKFRPSLEEMTGNDEELVQKLFDGQDEDNKYFHKEMQALKAICEERGLKDFSFKDKAMIPGYETDVKYQEGLVPDTIMIISEVDNSIVIYDNETGIATER